MDLGAGAARAGASGSTDQSGTASAPAAAINWEGFGAVPATASAALPSMTSVPPELPTAPAAQQQQQQQAPTVNWDGLDFLGDGGGANVNANTNFNASDDALHADLTLDADLS